MSCFFFSPSSIPTTVLLPSEFLGTPAERARLTSPGGKHHSERESGPESESTRLVSEPFTRSLRVFTLEETGSYCIHDFTSCQAIKGSL